MYICFDYKGNIKVEIIFIWSGGSVYEQWIQKKLMFYWFEREITSSRIILQSLLVMKNATGNITRVLVLKG
jgi:hypothetical protein